jgi:hypothetical protein
MTREALLRILLSQAKNNGFEFRKWFVAHIQPAWPGADEALAILCQGSRFYALVFSQTFARHFWKQGTQINFTVPSVTYTRRNPAGRIVTVSRKAFTRRTLKADVWRYHLRELAIAEDPLRYLRRFLLVEEDLAPAEKDIAKLVSEQAASGPRRN